MTFYNNQDDFAIFRIIQVRLCVLIGTETRQKHPSQAEDYGTYLDHPPHVRYPPDQPQDDEPPDRFPHQALILFFEYSE